MFKEFALDPSLIRDWASFDRFVNGIVWFQGRALSRCPSEWVRETLSALNSAKCRPVQRKKIVERLRRLEPEFVERVDMPASSDGNWYSLAKSEHARERFACAISRVNPERLEWVMRGDDFGSSDALFQPCGAPIDRTAKAFADALRFLLKAASKVHFVDPHFQPAERRFREPISALLDIACAPSVYRASSASLFLHLSLGNTTGLDPQMRATRAANLQRQIQDHVPSLIPAGRHLRVLIWDKVENRENVHNRYVLTERAGVLFGTGLDQQNGTGQTDDVCRLTKDQHAERMRLYNVTHPDFSPTFAKIDDISLIGTRIV